LENKAVIIFNAVFIGVFILSGVCVWF
jgi:hypothetical protein